MSNSDRASSSRPSAVKTVDVDEPELIFELGWKNSDKFSTNGKDIRALIGISDPNDPTLEISTFKSYLCQSLGVTGDVCISYIDSDNDELPIDSNCEFQEALKFARSRTKKATNVRLLVERIEGTDEHCTLNRGAPKKSTSNSDYRGVFVIRNQSSTPNPSIEMAPTVANGLLDEPKKKNENINCVIPPFMPPVGAIPPIWFRSYMETMKREIVEEVSTKVMAEVMGVLNNRAAEPMCPVCSCTSGSGCIEGTKPHCSKKRYRRKKDRTVDEADSSDVLDLSQIHSVQLLREVEKVERRKRHLQEKLHKKLEKLEKINGIIMEKKNRCRDAAAIAQNLNRSTECAKTAFRPATDSKVISTMSLQNDSPPEYAIHGNNSNSVTSRPRMNCSVTGQEILDKSTGRDTNYFSDSESDNVSIISCPSNMSDSDHDSNFELIHAPACFTAENPLNKCDAPSTRNAGQRDNGTTMSPSRQDFNVVCESDGNESEIESDRNNNRDSLSFEVLSEAASNVSSIHLDEDHFQNNEPVERPSNSDLIDFNQDESKAKKNSMYVIDTDGVIFSQKATGKNGDCSDMCLDKRPGGSYAYINTSLPLRESEDASRMSKSDTTAGKTTSDDSNLNFNIKSSQPSYTTSEETVAPRIEPTATVTPRPSAPSELVSSESSQESAHSFCSHTSRESTIQIQSNTSHSCPRYTLIDRNASKGLEETKYTSFENNLGARGCQTRKIEQTNEIHGKYQRTFTSEGAACVFTEQPKKSTSGEGANGGQNVNSDFGRTSQESVHILPETLVSGAVNVASSAYSTARRVIEKIRNMQTIDDEDRNVNGVPADSHTQEYFALLEDMGFTNMELNARLLNQFNYDLSRVISELVQ